MTCLIPVNRVGALKTTKDCLKVELFIIHQNNYFIKRQNDSHLPHI